MVRELPSGVVVETKPLMRCARRVKTRQVHRRRARLAQLATIKADSFVRKNGGRESIGARPEMAERASGLFIKARHLKARARLNGDAS